MKKIKENGITRTQAIFKNQTNPRGRDLPNKSGRIQQGGNRKNTLATTGVFRPPTILRSDTDGET